MFSAEHQAFVSGPLIVFLHIDRPERADRIRIVRLSASAMRNHPTVDAIVVIQIYGSAHQVHEMAVDEVGAQYEVSSDLLLNASRGVNRRRTREIRWKDCASLFVDLDRLHGCVTGTGVPR